MIPNSRRSGQLLRAAALLLTTILLGPAAASARTLHWSAMEVSARLDADGRLHVIERQTMVFDGDWNGGERGFLLRAGQEIELDRLSRIDEATGQVIDLTRGDIDRVDHYDWFDGDKLRWRSRLPSDPPFAGRTLIYELAYSLTGVLREEGDTYSFDHDFAFADRPGAIERFTLDLQLDPVWRAPETLKTRLEQRDLAPGRSVVVTTELRYLGAERPAAVPRSLPLALVLGLPLLSLPVMGGLFVRFLSGERAYGRFAVLDVPARIDEAWLEAHLLDLRPEEVGALWDRKVGAPEVAALIARLVGEEKLTSTVEERRNWLTRSQVLTLAMRVDRNEFRSYERRLIDKLFFDDRTVTDTEAIRKHYKSSGFSPSMAIAGEIERRLRKLPGLGRPRPAASWKPTAWLVLTIVFLIAIEALTMGAGSAMLLLAVGMMVFLPSLLGWAGAFVYRNRIRRMLLGTLTFLVPAFFVWSICFGTSSQASSGGGLVQPTGYAALLALSLIPIVIFRSFLNHAQSRESIGALRRRQRLDVARTWLREQLENPTPALRDEWFPYLLALGLNRQVDSWFKDFGGPASGMGRSHLSTFVSGTATGSSSWTGGGGSFGGAGATAAWASAAASLGAGVSKPGSSGGSGGGGGGGSSGGGSGGGW